MVMPKKVCWDVVFLLCAGTLLAQNAPSTTTPPAQNRPGHEENCFQQAGLERSVVRQIRSIGREAHAQIEDVCSNSALTPQEQNRQVREIREKAMQQRASLMTADQQKAVMACQEARHGYHPAASHGNEGHFGGCGEMHRGGSQPGGSTSGAPGNRNGSGNAPPPNQPAPQN